MVIFVAVVVVVAVVALVVAGLMRSGGDDTSVRSYHSAIGTLEHLSAPERRVQRSPSRGSPSQPVGTTSDADLDPSGSAVPPVPVRGNDEFPEPGEPLVFDDARPRDRYQSPPRTDVQSAARTSRAQRYALDSMNHRPRRVTGVVVAAVIVVAFAGLVYLGSHHSNGHADAGSHGQATTPTTHATTPTTAATAHHQSTAPKSPKTTTPTTAPTRIVSSTSSTTGTAATYPVANASFGLAIATTGPCWVDVTTVASGSTLWTGTLQAGQSQTVQATGPTTVELGSTGASMTVDGTPVVLPTDLHTPFTATFEPATSGAPSTTPTSAP